LKTIQTEYQVRYLSKLLFGATLQVVAWREKARAIDFDELRRIGSPGE